MPQFRCILSPRTFGENTVVQPGNHSPTVNGYVLEHNKVYTDFTRTEIVDASGKTVTKTVPATVELVADLEARAEKRYGAQIVKFEMLTTAEERAEIEALRKAQIARKSEPGNGGKAK